MLPLQANNIINEMKKILYTLFALVVAATALTSCDDTETYAEMKEAEEAAINAFIKNQGIKVISETDFHAQGDSTSVDNNEFVLIASKGVYMQIVEKGCGEKLKDGESASVLCRFSERNLNTDSLQLYNNQPIFSLSIYLDKMTVRNTSGTFSATFESGLMMSYYGTSSVPSGWLVPLTYINLGRPESEEDEIAHVRIIVPHDMGQSDASSNVYACYYDLTYERAL